MLWLIITVVLASLLLILLLATVFHGIKSIKVVKDLYHYQVFDLRPFPQADEITSRILQRTLKRFMPWYAVFDYSAIQFELPRWLQAYLIAALAALLWVAIILAVMLTGVEEFDVLIACVAGVVCTVILVLVTLVLTTIYLDGFATQSPAEEPLTTRNLDSPEPLKRGNYSPPRTNERFNDLTWNDISELHKTQALTDRELHKDNGAPRRTRYEPTPNARDTRRGTEDMRF